MDLRFAGEPTWYADVDRHGYRRRPTSGRIAHAAESARINVDIIVLATRAGIRS